MKKGYHHPPTTRKKISDSLQELFSDSKNHPMFGKHLPAKTRKKISDKVKEFLSNPINHPLFGKHHTPTSIKKMSMAKLGKNNPRGMLNKHHSPKAKKNISDHVKKLWKNQKHAKRMWRAFHKKPNNQELECFGYINQTVPKLFRYVGNGKLNVDGKFPDFVSTDGSRLLIEFNGEHWHKGENTRVLARHYTKSGYMVLFIWSRELKNSERLKKKILKFVTTH